ncbi:hypothetical protein VTI74DRAFT_5183 [Chaetomium olivicolor]
MLPFRAPKRPSHITNRGKKDPTRGRESEVLTDDFEAVASKIWRSGFGGTIKMPAARGMDPKAAEAMDYHELIRVSGSGSPSLASYSRTSDAEYIFFTKKNSDGEPIDKDGKAVVHEEYAEAGKKMWYVLDLTATLKDKNNRAALLEAFGGLPAGEKSERKWLSTKFEEWCQKYGDESLEKPKHEAAAISHKKVIDNWEAVKAEIDFVQRLRAARTA